MKKIILASLTSFIFYAMPTAATQPQSLAQQCRAMLEKPNPGVTMATPPWQKWVYYEGIPLGQTLKAEGKTAIEQLYAEALQNEISQRHLTESERAETPELSSSGQHITEPAGSAAAREKRAAEDKANFCQREIQALQKIVGEKKAPGVTGYVISSKSTDCLRILEEWCKK